jgi:hypothetical protein
MSFSPGFAPFSRPPPFLKKTDSRAAGRTTMRPKSLSLAIASLAVVVSVVMAANQKTDEQGNNKALPKDFKELVEAYKQLYIDAVRQRERLSWLSNNVFRPGMIIPFYGEKRDAEALEKEGWVVCDGRTIQDQKALAKYRGKPSPALQGRIIKGAEVLDKVGTMGGSPTITTSVTGNHGHLLPGSWYFRRFPDGGNNGHHGIDTFRENFAGINQPHSIRTQGEGNHGQTASVDPPHMSVIYIMYVREVAQRNK